MILPRESSTRVSVKYAVFCTQKIFGLKFHDSLLAWLLYRTFLSRFVDGLPSENKDINEKLPNTTC